MQKALFRNADIAKTRSASSSPDPSRLALAAKYLALKLSDDLLKPDPQENAQCRASSALAARLTLTRDLELDESNSERLLIDSALEKCSQRIAVNSERLEQADSVEKQQHAILSMLYPSHPSLDSIIEARSVVRKRISTLRKAMKDQTAALGKLNDASNLLLLISDHVEILNAFYVSPCNSSSSDWSSEDDGPKVGCLGRSDDSRSMIYISSVPGNYRIRYLRKCWGFAADALSDAVNLSSYISTNLERVGQSELIPGIDNQSKPSLSLFELPGGLTILLRADMLQKMANEAKATREVVKVWQLRQRKFVSRIRRDLTKSKRTVALHEAKMAELRGKLVAEEFPELFARAE